MIGISNVGETHAQQIQLKKLEQAVDRDHQIHGNPASPSESSDPTQDI